MAISIRSNLPPVRDQGPRPTCLAFAVTSVHGHLRQPTPPYVELSEEMLHQQAKLIGGHANGVILSSAEHALSTHGQCLLAMCPYQPSEGSHPVPASALADGLQRTATFESFTPAAASVRALIQSKIPVLLVLQIFPSFYAVADGMVPTPTAGEVLQGFHAVVGTGLVNRNGFELIEFRNSWSDTWGDQGYGYIEDAYLDQFCTDVCALKV